MINYYLIFALHLLNVKIQCKMARLETENAQPSELAM